MHKNKLIPLFTYFVLAFGIAFSLNRWLPDMRIVSVDLTAILTGLGPLLSGLICYRLFNLPNSYRITFSGVQPVITYAVLALMALLPVLFITKVPKTVIIASIITQFLYSLGEEYGWRHYLQNLTAGTSRWVWPFVTGTLWFFWHYSLVDNPVRVLTGQNLPPLIGIPVAILFLSLFSFLWGDLTVKTKSILMPAIAHSITKFGDGMSIGIVVTILLFLQIFWYKLKLGQPKQKRDEQMGLYN